LETRFGNSLWKLALGTRFGNSLWKLALETRFGNSLWKLALGTRFGNSLWELALGTRFGNSLWEIASGSVHVRWVCPTNSHAMVASFLCARTFQGVHSVRLWTPTIFNHLKLLFRHKM
jgi:hypothetical protein